MEQGDRVICAISGGADSVALLWCLYLLREQLDLKLSAAHLNHGLRGEESDRDEDFVRQLCAGYQIPLTVGRTQVQAQGRGLEDAARRARYTFLESLDPAAKIATAHTADDNAETVLLHLIRGAGLRGLGGIAPARGRVIRPMLGVTRQEVEAFLVPAGTAVELYETTHHYAPATAPGGSGFRVVVVLPRGTNTGLPQGLERVTLEDRLMTACNKWLIAHPDAPEAAQGAFVGLFGENPTVD